MTDPKRTKITLNVNDFVMSQQQPGRIMWPDGTEVSAEQFNNSVTIATEAYAIGQADALKKAMAAIKERYLAFNKAGADGDYLNAMNDAWGLLKNQLRETEREGL